MFVCLRVNVCVGVMWFFATNTHTNIGLLVRQAQFMRDALMFYRTHPTHIHVARRTYSRLALTTRHVICRHHSHSRINVQLSATSALAELGGSDYVCRSHPAMLSASCVRHCASLLNRIKMMRLSFGFIEFRVHGWMA